MAQYMTDKECLKRNGNKFMAINSLVLFEIIEQEKKNLAVMVNVIHKAIDREEKTDFMMEQFNEACEALSKKVLIFKEIGAV